MKVSALTLAATAAFGVAFSASAALAQGVSFDGGYVAATYTSNYYGSNFNYSTTDIYGGAQVSYGNFALQADIGTFGYDSNPLDSPYYVLHAMYNISPKLVVGGYYGQDLWSNGSSTYSTYGAEARFTPGFLDGKLSFEAFGGVYVYENNPTGNTNPMIGLGATYAVNDRISLGVSYLRGAWDQLSNPADQYDTLKLEGTYRFANGLYTKATYSNILYQGSTFDYYTLGISLGFTFGDGVTFGRRGYSALYPGD